MATAAVVPESATLSACPGVLNVPSSRGAAGSDTSTVARPSKSIATYATAPATSMSYMFPGSATEPPAAGAAGSEMS